MQEAQWALLTYLLIDDRRVAQRAQRRRYFTSQIRQNHFGELSGRRD